MKRAILFVFAALTATLAWSQVCDVTYSVDTATADGNDVGTSVTVVRALPMADVLDNAAKFNQVLDVASKEQEKGGPYTGTMDEVRVCDGGKPVKAQGIEVRGVTLKGANKIGREALKQADAILKRYEQRDAKGANVGWDHSKAKKVERDDLGKRK